MAAEKKRRYHHGDLRNALMDAALSRIAVHGAYSVSLREVARSIGVSHAAAYRHFPSKDDLLAAIAEEGFTMLGDALSTAFQKYSDDPVAAFQASGIAYVEFGVEHPEHLQIMFSGILGDFAKWPSLKKAGERAYAMLKQGARKAQPNSEDVLAIAAWSLVHGLTLLIVGGQVPGGRKSARKTAKDVTSLLVR